MTENLVGDEYRTVGRTYQVWALFEAGRGLAREVKTLGPLATAEEQIVLAQRGFVLKKAFVIRGYSRALMVRTSRASPNITATRTFGLRLGPIFTPGSCLVYGSRKRAVRFLPGSLDFGRSARSEVSHLWHRNPPVPFLSFFTGFSFNSTIIKCGYRGAHLALVSLSSLPVS